jgi:hypothetical protein
MAVRIEARADGGTSNMGRYDTFKGSKIQGEKHQYLSS